MFILNNGKSGVKFYKKTAADLVTSGVVDRKTAIVIARSKDMGDSRSLLFKNTIDQTVMVAFAKAPVMNEGRLGGPQYSMVGAVFNSTGTITVSNAAYGTTSPLMSTNNVGLWTPGSSFRFLGSTSNDNKTFVISSMAGNVITVNTVLGSTPVNETVANTSPIMIRQLSLVDGFEVPDGDAISLDLSMNRMDIVGDTGDTEVYIYPLGLVTSSASKAFRIYSFCL